MKKLLVFTFLTLLSTLLQAKALKTSGTGIAIASRATHVAFIKDDTVVVITGSTYLFTVDTPEDQGLISTGTTVNHLTRQITSKDGSLQIYKITTENGTPKKEGMLTAGDRLIVISEDKRREKKYIIKLQPMAVGGKLQLNTQQITANTNTKLTLYFTAGQRSPDATVHISLPKGIHATLENTTVNVIGRGAVKLKDLDKQSIGRTGSRYSYSKVGDITISSTPKGQILKFQHLDFRPLNGPDLEIVISSVNLPVAGKYLFKASYTTSKPEILNSPGTGAENVSLAATRTISDFQRVLTRNMQYQETASTYSSATFKWGFDKKPKKIQLMQSIDKGKNWAKTSASIDQKNATVTVSNLTPHKLYAFRLLVTENGKTNTSNPAYFYTGKMDIKDFGVTADGKQDNTESINKAINYLNQIGGGTLLFSQGIYNVRTLHLKSNVYLYIDKNATISAIKGADAPESTWFSDKKYRSGLSPTDSGPYADPENYMTKQDVGHHYFRNCMFFGERLDNVKIIGNGLITGKGNLVNGDNVMKNPPDNRADKMFTFKLCTNLEIGGIHRQEDLWYDLEKDEPYYIGSNGAKIFDHDNMLKIDRAGHFVLLATGTDNINVHNTYFAKDYQSNARDIYDFMGCNNVTATNIYSKVSSDDIIKPGSDCSLGFTRPARNYKVRNIIGDTNCNLFQVGSETADDIKDICVDNIYVLGANKAGFSISTNDGAHISDIHLNCGHTGKLHSRSKMYRTRAPFFISISNRARILGAVTGRYVFTENGIRHDELLVKNVNIGKVENIIINGIDVSEVYGGSSYGGKNGRWKAYDGSQKKATPIIAGYKLPDTDSVKGGLDFKLPNGRHTGYISNIWFNDVNILVKGGNLVSDTTNLAPELGVGQYNVADLKVQPSYGLWARHVKGLKVSKSTFNYETRDSRYTIFLDDVLGAQITSVTAVLAKDNSHIIKLKNSSDIVIQNLTYYKDIWRNAPAELLKIP